MSSETRASASKPKKKSLYDLGTVLDQMNVNALAPTITGEPAAAEHLGTAADPSATPTEERREAEPPQVEERVAPEAKHQPSPKRAQPAAIQAPEQPAAPHPAEGSEPASASRKRASRPRAGVGTANANRGAVIVPASVLSRVRREETGDLHCYWSPEFAAAFKAFVDELRGQLGLNSKEFTYSSVAQVAVKHLMALVERRELPEVLWDELIAVGRRADRRP